MSRRALWITHAPLARRAEWLSQVSIFYCVCARQRRRRRRLRREILFTSLLMIILPVCECERAFHCQPAPAKWLVTRATGLCERERGICKITLYIFVAAVSREWHFRFLLFFFYYFMNEWTNFFLLILLYLMLNRKNKKDNICCGKSIFFFP